LKARPTYHAEKADIFSLGILLFTMMFGQPPFMQNDPQRSPLLSYLCSGNIVFVDFFFKTHELTKHRIVSPQLKHLLMKMLAFSPEMRPTLESLLDEDEWLTKGYNG